MCTDLRSKSTGIASYSMDKYFVYRIGKHLNEVPRILLSTCLAMPVMQVCHLARQVNFFYINFVASYIVKQCDSVLDHTEVKQIATKRDSYPPKDEMY